MSDKLVHVNAYTKDDGTKVREHYRGGVKAGFVEGGEIDPSAVPHGIVDGTCTAGSIEELFKSRGGGLLDRLKKILNGDPEVYTTTINDVGASVLEGGVSTDVYYPSGSGMPLPEMLGPYTEAVQIAMAMAEIASGLAIKGAETVAAIKFALKNWDKVGASKLGVQMDEVVGQMRQAHDVSVSAEQKTLEMLSNTTNQREYKDLYDTYLAQRESNRATGAIINRIAYSTEHKNYDDVEKGLNEYKALQTESASAVRNRANLNAQSEHWQVEEQPLPYMLPDISDMRKNIAADWDKTLDYAMNTGLHDYPQVQKSAISGYMNFKYSEPAYDASELWKAAAYDFKYSGEYIAQNGYLLDTIDDLSELFQNIIRRKVKQQFGMYDSKGLILMPYSTLSQEIAKSPELKAFLKEKKSELLSGKTVSGSTSFSSNENLALALGKAEIINTYINENGDVVAYVLDTYDFNKDDPRWKVKVAYNVQRNGLITNFYTLNVVIIPKEQWMF